VNVLSVSRALEASKTSWFYKPTKTCHQNIEKIKLTLLIVKGPNKSAKKKKGIRGVQKDLKEIDASFKILQ